MPEARPVTFHHTGRAATRGEATMVEQDDGWRRPVTRRGALVGALAAGMASTVTPPSSSVAAAQADDGDALFAVLDQKIMKGMARYSIPGAAVGVIWRGRSYLRGYGVTDISNPQPINADTLFRPASIAKTFTGTAAMRLIDQGSLVLDGQVDSYVNGFIAAAGAQSVTVRQLLNHSAGWLGDDLHDTGSDDGALARYVSDIRNLPQLTPVGQVFSYNNTALNCAGRVIERVTGLTYENAVEQLILHPLGMSRSLCAATTSGLDNLALPHGVGDDGEAVVNPEAFYQLRCINPAGAQWLSSARDLLAFAQFHLGDGLAADGQRVMSLAALRGMWSTPGPGGTLSIQLTGMGVSWQVRPTAQDVVVLQHGGTLFGYHSCLMLVPAQQFAMVLLTNGDLGGLLTGDLFTKDWALRRFAGLTNTPAPAHRPDASALADYEGYYQAETIPADGQVQFIEFQLTGRPDGALQLTFADHPDLEATLTFYADDYVIDKRSEVRSNFVRDESGAVAWLRYSGRLYRLVGLQPQEPPTAPSDDEVLADYV